MNIRPYRPGDETAISVIYNHFIINTVATFEETPLTVEQMKERIEFYLQSYPWYVCELDGKVVGYSYARKFHERAAYRFTAEATVYVKDGLARRGIGKSLYEKLLSELFSRGCHVVIGAITLPNQGSVGLHESLGFTKVGHLSEVGRKFDRWIDVGYWQKKLASHSG
jgi:phosphinothricin acetyltransferase